MAHSNTRPIYFPYLPVASMWVVTLHSLLCNRTHPYPVTLLSIGSGYSLTKYFPVRVPQQFSNLVILQLPAYEDGSVPKRRHIKFRGREITQNKAQNIQNTAKA